jgi:RHS repeat-associated protein
VTRKLNGAVQGSEEYWYDEKNARYLVVKKNATGTKTGATWFIEESEAHYDATGAVVRVFGHVSMGTPVARLDRSSDGPSSLEYQFHGLANNTLATIEQSTGVTNASFVYAPFGEIIEATDGGAATNDGLAVHPRRMNDKFIDQVSGLAYYGFRYYDKLSMGWTQADPVYIFAPALAKSSTSRRALLYTFSLNNPLRYVDPDGRDSKKEQARGPIWCKDSSNGCSIDTGPAVYKGGAGTRKNWEREEARILADAAMSSGHGITVGASNPGEGGYSELTAGQAAVLRHWLLKALTNSPSLRHAFSMLLMSDNAFIAGYTFLFLSNKGESETRYARDPKSKAPVAKVFFNPADVGSVWQGKLFQAGGRAGGKSTLAPSTPDAGLAHELGHAYLLSSGKASPNNKKDELAATAFENMYRREAGQMSRDKYTANSNW